MAFLKRRMFNVWLIASGQSRADLEEALRGHALGHNLTVIPDETAFDVLARDIDRDADRFPNLLMYLVRDSAQAPPDFLHKLKASADFRHVPVIVFHTGRIVPDIKHLYSLGAASVIRVPIKFHGLVSVMRTIEAYWFNVASPPPIDGPLRTAWARHVQPL
ncbi:hypothetical protein MD273_13575 [Marinobacter pelagius]|uniref:hypothetical protein n=1 Tax=Marinobacter sp. C7 TaxID=2951363 RepID=UPI001EF10DB1|nr:hypothetical protein [Marinobacter sp. C7]MCG7200759.1 hypothetical protein [Marinobacter sp. C7]